MNVDRITAELLEQAWSQILQKLPFAGGKTFLQKGLSHGPISLRATVRVQDAMPGLLLLAPDNLLSAKWVVKQLSGIRFEPPVKLVEGYGYPLMLGDPKAREIFALLAADLSSAIASEAGATTMVETLLSRVSLWRRFLQHRASPMTEEEVRGLIGELCILDHLLRTKSTDAALESWQGPRGELHDFRLTSLRIEVKTWTNNSLPRIFISDPSQIIVDETCPVWLAVVQITNDDISGRPLSELASTLRGRMDNAQRDIYDTLLADYGYLAEHAGLYPERYGNQQPVYYKITDTFPRIDAATIPPGLCAVRYAIELSAISRHERPSPVSLM